MPERRNIVVIGYGTAGMTAAGYARLTDRRSRVIVVEKRSYPVYHPCSIPDVVSGEISPEAIVETRSPGGITLMTSTVAEEIDCESRRVKVRNLKTDSSALIEYDKLILATGSIPLVPRKMKGVGLKGVFTVKNAEDSKKIRDAATRSRRAVIVGASAIGLEMAVALRELGLEVTLVDMKPHVMPGKLDPDISRLIEEELRNHGVSLVLGHLVDELIGEHEVKAVAVRKLNGEETLSSPENPIESDMVVLAMGVRPNVELARQIGVELGETGAIKVNERMETSIPDVYAGGDCVESKSLLTGKPMLAQFASVAFLHGKAAGINAAGGDAVLPGVIVNWVVSTRWFTFGAVGLTMEMCEAERINCESITINKHMKPDFYGDSERVAAKLIVGEDDGRILGLQVYSRSPLNMAYLLDVFSLAISKGLTVKDLRWFEHAYAPQVSDIPDIILSVSDAMARRLSRKAGRRRTR